MQSQAWSPAQPPALDEFLQKENLKLYIQHGNPTEFELIVAFVVVVSC